MWYLITLFILFFLSILQLSFLESFKHIHLIPNLFLIYSVYIAIHEDFKKSVALSLSIGLILDIVAASFFGFYILFFITLSLAIDIIKTYIGRTKTVALTVIITAISSFVLILFEIVPVVLTKGISLYVLWPVIKLLSLGALASILGAFILHPILHKFYNWTKKDNKVIQI